MGVVETRLCDHPQRRLRTWLDGGGGVTVACLKCGRLIEGAWRFRPGRTYEELRVRTSSSGAQGPLSPWVAITSAGKGGHAHERASPQDKPQGHPRVGAGALLQQRDYVGGPCLLRRGGNLLRAQGQGERHSALHIRDDRRPEDRRRRTIRRLAGGVESPTSHKANCGEFCQGELCRKIVLRSSAPT